MYFLKQEENGDESHCCFFNSIAKQRQCGLKSPAKNFPSPAGSWNPASNTSNHEQQNLRSTYDGHRHKLQKNTASGQKQKVSLSKASTARKNSTHGSTDPASWTKSSLNTPSTPSPIPFKQPLLPAATMTTLVQPVPLPTNLISRPYQVQSYRNNYQQPTVGYMHSYRGGHTMAMPTSATNRGSYNYEMSGFGRQARQISGNGISFAVSPGKGTEADMGAVDAVQRLETSKKIRPRSKQPEMNKDTHDYAQQQCLQTMQPTIGSQKTTQSNKERIAQPQTNATAVVPPSLPSAKKTHKSKFSNFSESRFTESFLPELGRQNFQTVQSIYSEDKGPTRKQIQQSVILMDFFNPADSTRREYEANLRHRLQAEYQQ